MKKVLLVTASLIALGAAAPAMAADLAARPYTKAPPMIAAVYDWSGFYIGANGGWGSSRNSWDSATPFAVGPEGSHDATGGTVGGQIGYRWQTGTWVFGAFGLFTGQIGYAANNVLFYLKGGAAVTDNRNRIYSTATNTVFGTTGDTTRWGGTVGVGLEYGFAPNWSVGVEYDHLFLQDKTLTFTSPATGLAVGADRIRQDVDLVTVRLNYKFGGPIIAKY